MKSQIENPPPTFYVGVDVSKDKLDLSSQTKTVPNTKRSINALLKRLTKNSPGVLHVVCEATGGYERHLVTAAHAQQITVSVVNARQIRDFAKASGKLAKNDQIDAQVIQRWAEIFKPKGQSAPSECIVEIRALSRRRYALVEQRTQEKVRLPKADDPYVIADIKRLIKFFDNAVERIDKQIAKATQKDAEVVKIKERLKQVKGGAEVVSSTLIAEMPELAKISDKEASALAGVAPFTRQSGKWEGRSFIAGGRQRVRRALYLAAMSTRRFNPTLKKFYDRLTEAGKPFKLAITAVMRKLICLLNRMLAEPSFTLK